MVEQGHRDPDATFALKDFLDAGEWWLLNRVPDVCRQAYEDLFSCSTIGEQDELVEIIADLNDAYRKKYAKELGELERPKTAFELEVERGYWDKNSPHYMGGVGVLPVESGGKVMPAGGISHSVEG